MHIGKIYGFNFLSEDSTEWAEGLKIPLTTRECLGEFATINLESGGIASFPVSSLTLLAEPEVQVGLTDRDWEKVIHSVGLAQSALRDKIKIADGTYLLVDLDAEAEALCEIQKKIAAQVGVHSLC